MSPSRVLLYLMRLTALVQVAIGIGLWTGHWRGAVAMHMVTGTAYVMLLWILALIALFQRRTIGTALFAIFWGFCVAMLGYMQQGILAGSDLHWVVRVVHLAIGLLALGLAEQLAPARRVEATMTTAAV